MQDQKKTKAQLIAEVQELRQRVADLEDVEANYRKTAQSLRETEEKFRVVLESVPDFIATITPDHRILHINRTVPELRLDQVIGSNFYDYIPLEAQTAARTCIERVFMTGQTDSYDSIGLGPAGEMAWYECRVGPIKQDDRVVAVTIVATDISKYKLLEQVLYQSQAELERRVAKRTADLSTMNAMLQAEITKRQQIENALRQSEQKYRTLVEATDDVILLTDLEGRHLFRNSAYYRSLGFDEGDPVDLNGFARVHPEDIPELKQSLATLLQSGKASSEYRIQHKDGSWIHRLARSVILYDEAKKPETILSIIRDVSERKLIEQELRESEAKFRTLAETTAAGIFIYQGSRFIYTNNAASEQTGYTTLELSNLNFWDFVHPDSQDLMKKRGLARQQGESAPISDEVKIVTKRGEIRHLYYSAGMVEYKGTPAAIATTFDITDRKEAEMALQKNRDRYHGLFEDSPISLWEEDFSEVKQYLDRLREQGVEDFRAYFEQYPEALIRCADLVKIIDVNQATLELFQAENKATLQTGLSQIFNQKSYKEFRKQLVAMAEGQISRESEGVSVTLTGQKRYTRWKWSITPDRQETWSQVLVSLIDITKSKQAEEELYKNQQLLESVINNNAAIIYVKDLEGRHLLVNDLHSQVFELNLADVIGKSDLEIFPKDTASAFRKNDELVLKEKRAIQFEEIAPHEDGWHTYISIKFPLFDTEGQIYATAGISTDITERKRIEETLAKMEQRYRSLFDEAPAMYVVTRDEAGQPLIADANQRFLETLGYSWAETQGQPLVNFYTPASATQMLTGGGHQRAMAGQFVAEERTLVTRTGRTIQTVLQSVPEFDDAGQAIGTRAMYVDITRNKRLEERLAAIHQLGRELTLIREEGKIIQQVLKTAQLVLRCHYIACGLIDQATNKLHLHYYTEQDFAEQLHLYLPLDRDTTPPGITVTVARNGQAIRIADVQQDPRYVDANLGWAGRSTLCVPMKVGERVIGVLNAESEQIDHFTSGDQRILQILADQAAVALENAALYAETERRARELVALNKAGRAMAASLDLNTVMEEALTEIKTLLNAEGASLLLLDPASDELVFAAAASPGAEAMIGLRLSLTSGIAGWVVRHKQSILVTEAQQDDRFYKLVDAVTGLTTQSLIAVPLLHQEQVIGVIESINKAEGQFDPHDLELLEALASSAVIAIENARLHAEMRQRLKAQTALREISLIISSTLDLESVLYRIAEQMCHLVDVTSVYISRYEPAIPAITPIAEYISPQAHPQEKISDIGTIYSLQQGFEELLEALQTGQHLLTQAGDPNLNEKRRQHFLDYAGQTVLDIPMRITGQTIALATMWESRQQRNFTFDQITLLYDLAQHAAIAMENARLHTETQERLNAQVALRQAGAAIFSTLEMDTVLFQIAQQMGQAIEATSAYICSYDSKTLHSTILAEYISPNALPEEQNSDLGVTYDLRRDFPNSIKHFETVEVWVTHSHDPALTESELMHSKHFGVQTTLVIPLKFRGQVRAYAEIWESRCWREFSEAEITLCQDIAQQAVVAIENAQLHAETERRAKQLSVLHELDQAITASLNIDDLYAAFAHHAIRLIDYDRMSIILTQNDQLRLAYILDEAETELRAGMNIPYDSPNAAQVLITSKPLIQNNVPAEKPHFRGRRPTAPKLHSILMLPLRAKGQIIGIWNMGSHQTEAYDQDDLQIAQSMADQLAIAIENVRLFEAEKIQRHRTEALQAAGATVSNTLDLNVVLDRLLVELGKVVPYDSASVFLMEEEDYLRITIARSLPDRSPIGQRFEPNELAKIVEQTRQPLILADARKDSRFQRWKGARHVRGWMNVPLIARNEFIGHITLDNRQPGAYTQTDAQLAMSFANQVAVAVENARLYQNLQKQMQVLEETQGQLLQNEKLAALGRLSAAIAHEINNPLQIIQSGLLLFKDKLYADLVDEKLKHYLEVAEREIDRLSMIMHRMRNFYPAMTKTQPALPASLDLLSDFYHSTQYDLQSINLQVMLESELKLLEKYLQQKSVKVEYKWMPNLSAIQGNPSHLQQVFLNLMINAVEAMTPQGGTLFLQTRPGQIDDANLPLTAVCVEISDTGPGISAEYLARLFEPFFSTKENGSGLGLFVSHKIIEAHHGQIRVESRLGLGTTFCILLPVEQT